MPGQSIGRTSCSFTFGTKARTSATPATAIGRFRKKIQRQLTKVTIAPPSTGPTTGPSSAGMVTTDMAPTSSFFGVVRSSTSRPTGPIMAPAQPCSRRNPTSWPRLVAKPQAAEDSA
jgi:hypothetical protein